MQKACNHLFYCLETYSWVMTSLFSIQYTVIHKWHIIFNLKIKPLELHTDYLTDVTHPFITKNTAIASRILRNIS